ncbi:MobA/MobL family protein [Erythrobacter sp. R86502]|uniref:MobA/MobL family protein n=1 Tax=Erythrobacter sp. R86502 TaxID=3093846 RepID=UPI0036D2CE1B
MQKTKPSRSSARTPPTSKDHRYIAATFIDDFGISRKLSVTSASSFSKKKLAAATRRTVRLADAELDRAMRAGDRETALAIRRLRKQERAADRSISNFFRRRIKTVEPQIEKVKHQPTIKITSRWPFREVALPRYSAAIFDSQKRRGVFMRVEYYGAKTSKAGVAMRACRYIFRGCALDEDGRPLFESNLGLSVEEAVCALDHLEQINRSAQKNAKVLFHTVLALDHRWSKAQQFQVAREWAEECFGQHGLPYAIALHSPDPDGDARNWHAHVLSSYRPMVRLGTYEWEVGEAVRTDLDNPKAMQLLRENFARAMTRMSREAGQCERHTALSYAARGLPIEPQQHLGEARTRKVRAGEFVAANEENHSRVSRSVTALAQTELEKRMSALERQKRPLMAAMSRILAAVKSPHVPSRAIVASKLALPATKTRPALRRAEPTTSVTLPASTVRVASIHVPSGHQSAQNPPLSSLEIANLRFPAAASQANVFSLDPSELLDARTLRHATRVTGPEVPRVSSRSAGFSCPSTMSASVPPLSSLGEFPRPSRSLETEEESVTEDQARPLPPARSSAEDGGIPHDLKQLMERLRTRKRLIRKRDHHFELPIDLMDEIGMAQRSLLTPAVQDLLRAEYFRQVDDIGLLAGHFAAKPGDLYAVTGGWRAHHDVPRHIREEVDRWLTEPRLQTALQTFVGRRQVDPKGPEYERRISLVYDFVYRRTEAQASQPGDTQDVPAGTAVAPAEVGIVPAKGSQPSSRAEDASRRPTGPPFPGPDLDRKAT